MPGFHVGYGLRRKRPRRGMRIAAGDRFEASLPNLMVPDTGDSVPLVRLSVRESPAHIIVLSAFGDAAVPMLGDSLETF